jgi:hypothetical protein
MPGPDERRIGRDKLLNTRGLRAEAGGSQRPLRRVGVTSCRCKCSAPPVALCQGGAPDPNARIRAALKVEQLKALAEAFLKALDDPVSHREQDDQVKDLVDPKAGGL